MFRERSPAEHRKTKTSASSSKNSSELVAIPFMSLDLTPGAGNLLDEFYWEILSPWRGESSILNTGPAPRSGAAGSTLWSILEERPHPKYYLSQKACQGILRRSHERGKELPWKLERALKIQSGLLPPDGKRTGRDAYHINQRDEGIDLHGVSGALMATTNMQMQTFVTGAEQETAQGVDGYNGDLTGGVSATLGTNCGMSTGRNGVMMPMAFAQNQRNEVRDLCAVAGALGSQPGMKQQTFVASGVVTKGNGDCFLSEEKHTALSTGGGQAGQGYPCVLVTAQKEPEVLCLNDQGGQFMSSSKNITGTLRAQMNQHQPLVLATQQGGAEIGEGVCPTITASAGMSGNNQPVLYENHGIDSRYNGPLPVSPTIDDCAETRGNNLPLVEQESDVFCIMGNAIDRQPHNGGNGIGYSGDIAYTLTATDRHAVFSRQRTDQLQENDVVSTESARQHKDATDLVMQPYQETVGTLVRSDHKGISNQYVSDDKCVVENINLIRRLTPLECERLQGFPDGWTDIPDASDSARYKALGNSVAIPCVDFVMRGIAAAIRSEHRRRQLRLINTLPLAA